MPVQTKPVKCLSASELKNAMDQILGNYSLCINPVKKKANAIMLSLNEMMITDGQSNGLLDESNEKETGDLMSTSINGLINEHRNSFLSSKNNFTMNNIVSTDYLKRPKNHFRKHKKK